MGLNQGIEQAYFIFSRETSPPSWHTESLWSLRTSKQPSVCATIKSRERPVSGLDRLQKILAVELAMQTNTAHEVSMDSLQNVRPS